MTGIDVFGLVLAVLGVGLVLLALAAYFAGRLR